MALFWVGVNKKQIAGFNNGQTYDIRSTPLDVFVTEDLIDNMVQPLMKEVVDNLNSYIATNHYVPNLGKNFPFRPNALPLVGVYFLPAMVSSDTNSITDYYRSATIITIYVSYKSSGPGIGSGLPDGYTIASMGASYCWAMTVSLGNPAFIKYAGNRNAKSCRANDHFQWMASFPKREIRFN
jgi:hypothetical protein